MLGGFLWAGFFKRMRFWLTCLHPPEKLRSIRTAIRKYKEVKAINKALATTSRQGSHQRVRPRNANQTGLHNLWLHVGPSCKMHPLSLPLKTGESKSPVWQPSAERGQHRDQLSCGDPRIYVWIDHIRAHRMSSSGNMTD